MTPFAPTTSGPARPTARPFKPGSRYVPAPAAASDQPHALLLSEGTIAGLRAGLAAETWPRKRLIELALAVADAERTLHKCQVHSDAGGTARARWARMKALAALEAEQLAVADVHLAGRAHALQFKPDECVEQLVAELAHPSARAALAPILESLLGPTVDWLRGEQTDLAERSGSLEVVVADLADRVQRLEALLEGRP